MGTIGRVDPTPLPEPSDAEEGSTKAPPPASEASRAGPLGGAWAARTSLQKHVDFFDGNKDGTITVSEASQGIKALGLPGAAAGPVVLVLGPSTTGRLLPLNINVANIHKAKHEGDAGVWDSQGNFSKERFDQMWRRTDKDRDGVLTESEVHEMIKTNNPSFFSKGRVLSRFAEFDPLLKLAGKTNAKGERTLSRETMAAFYDGTLFPKIAAERAGAKGAAPATGASSHDARKIGGPLPGLARASGGPLAGPGALAAMGSALCVDDAARTAGLTAPMIGAMRAVCPYMGTR